MSDWIDFNMLMDEIGLHRYNAQQRILAHREKEKPWKTSPSEFTQWDFVDRLMYENEVGAEQILMCLQNWCNDFKFSSDEVKEFIKEEENKL